MNTIDWIDGEMCQQMDVEVLSTMFGEDLEWDKNRKHKSYSCGQKLEVNYKMEKLIYILILLVHTVGKNSNCSRVFKDE